MEKQRESVANYRILTHSWAINQNFELCQSSTSEPKATGLTTDRWILRKDEKVDILWRGREIYGQTESNAADEQPWQIWETGLFLLINVKHPAWLHLRPPAATVLASKYPATVKILVTNPSSTAHPSNCRMLFTLLLVVYTRLVQRNPSYSNETRNKACTCYSVFWVCLEEIKPKI